MVRWFSLIVSGLGAAVSATFVTVETWDGVKQALLVALSVLAGAVLVRLARGLPFTNADEFEVEEIRALTKAVQQVMRSLKILIFVTKRWQFDRSILNQTIRTDAHAEHVRANLNPLQRWIVEAVIRGRFVDPKGNLPEIALEGATAIAYKREDESLGIAVRYGFLMDLFRAGVPGPAAQKEFGTPDQIKAAMEDLLGAEDGLKQVRKAERERCFIVKDLETVRGVLISRGLVSPDVFADADADADQDDAETEAVIRVAGTRAERKAPDDVRSFTRAVRAFLDAPDGPFERATLEMMYSALRDRFPVDTRVVAFPAQRARS